MAEEEVAPALARRRRSRRRRVGTAPDREAQAAPRPGRGQFWMLVSSPDNLRRTRERGFSAQGLKRAHRRRVETMRPGDRLLYYVTGRMAFAATATLASGIYEDHGLIWRSARREEDYPWRVRLRPDLVLEDWEWIPAREIAYRLDYVRKWPPEHWTLAFQGQLHQIPRKDFELIESEMRKLGEKAAGSADRLESRLPEAGS